MGVLCNLPMDSAIGFAKDTICCLFAKLYDYIQSLRSLGDDFRKMQSRFKSVDARKQDIIDKLQVQGRDASEVVRDWMVQRITNAYNRENGYLFGRCPDCWSVLTLSARIRQCIVDIEDLSDRGSFGGAQLGKVRTPPVLRAVVGEELVGATLPASLGLLKEFAYLNLSRTHIKELTDSIGALTCLQFLNLSHCKQLTSLQLTICELKSLRSLRLVDCEKLSAIGKEICRLTCLETLTMEGSNIFVGEGSAEMETNEICFKDLAKLRSLREISLKAKSPVTKGLLGRCVNMKYLELDFSHTNQEDLPEDMQAMDQLEYFVGLEIAIQEGCLTGFADFKA